MVAGRAKASPTAATLRDSMDLRTRASGSMNADGSGKTRLTKGAVRGIYPSGAPDGKQIAFVRPFDDGYRIFIMNADGSALARVTRPPSGVTALAAVNDLFPAWLPNGKIAFLRMLQVLEVNPDGSGLRPLTKKGEDAFRVRAFAGRQKNRRLFGQQG